MLETPPAVPVSSMIYSPDSSIPETPPAVPVSSVISSPDSTVPETPPAIHVLNIADRPVYDDFGDPTYVCPDCYALFWYEERCRKDSRVDNPVYNLCCRGGRVDLPAVQPTPPALLQLLNPLGGPDSKHFLDNIRMYNSMFALTSMGVQVDNTVRAAHGPYVYRISGQLCHLMGSLIPDDDAPPQFAQLYMYDTENEIANRLSRFSGSDQYSVPRPHIVQALKEMLDQHNPYIQAFRSVRERIIEDSDNSLRLRIISHRSGDGRQYAAPTASEVVGLIVGDLDSQHFDRDIIVHRRSGQLQRISSLHPSYMPSQYPLLFVHGEDSFRLNIPYSTADLSSSSRVRQHVTMNEYYCYRLHVRTIGSNIILRSGRLLQQISVDMFACVDQSRLWYIHQNQSSLRSDTFQNVRNAVLNYDLYGHTVGRRIILPPSHVGVIHSVEFQKRGLPHVHIILWLANRADLADGASIDQVISAELPDPAHDPDAYDVVSQFMMHGPCGAARPNSPCRDRARISVNRNPNPGPGNSQQANEPERVIDEQVANNPANQRTKLTAWFELNTTDPQARNLTYPEVTKLYTWHDDEKKWQFRLQGYRLARMNFAQPGAGEIYYLRILLNCVRGAPSFEALRTVNHIIHPTFKEACNALGLLDDNTEWLSTMEEAAAMASSQQLRQIFIDMLLYSQVADARQLWESLLELYGR
ncbi:hypothetical protein LUZ62_048820 [Rhynchospora pubera]|uniref:Helitron helicase-like domain-containing protein n=1 Tax=Rhynchospora pubera TaxID=906938 RepID=A0AAV8G0J4_9POAL|nr:hypothetical protein LUZ62_048820 [Rhynchospora pubera]